MNIEFASEFFWLIVAFFNFVNGFSLFFLAGTHPPPWLQYLHLTQTSQHNQVNTIKSTHTQNTKDSGRMSSAYERLISICWRNCCDSNTLTVAEIRSFVTEIELFLGVGHLLQPRESDLLRQLIARNPRMELRQEEAEVFLLRLVGCDSMDQLLLTRFKYSLLDVTRLVEAYPAARSTSTGRNFGSSTGRDFGSSTRQYRELNETHFNNVLLKPIGTYELLQDRSSRLTSDTSNALAAEKPPAYNGPVEDSTWYQRIKNSTLSFLPRSLHDNSKSKALGYSSALHSDDNNRPFLKKEEQDPVSYSERSVGHRSSPSSGSAFFPERTWRSENKFRQYEASSNQDDISSIRLAELKKVLADQEALISRLEKEKGVPTRKRHLASRFSSPVHSITNLLGSFRSIGTFGSFGSLRPSGSYGPSGTYGFKSTLLNLFALFLLAVLALNILKLFYFIVVLYFQNWQPTSDIDDTFEDDVSITFSWIQELPWLEYKIYEFKEWAGY